MNFTATNSIVCCYVIIITHFCILVNYYLKYFVVLLRRIELRILTYQASVIPFNYKSKTGWCVVAGNRTPISNTVRQLHGFPKVLAGIKVCCIHPITGLWRRSRTSNSTILKVLRTSKGLEPFTPTTVGLSTISAFTDYLAPSGGIEPPFRPWHGIWVCWLYP